MDAYKFFQGRIVCPSGDDMSRILLVLNCMMLQLVFGFSFVQTAGASLETPTGLPTCQTSQFRAVDQYFFSSDFKGDQVLLAAATRPGDEGWKLYRSTDGGVTWTLNLNEYVLAMSFSPTYVQDGTIYAIPLPKSSPGYFLRSTDRSATWERIGIPAEGPGIGGSALAVVDPQTLYYGAATTPGPADPIRRGLFRFDFSADGVNWEQLTYRNVDQIALSPNFAQDQTMFISESGYKVNYGLSKSTDGGRIWTPSSNGIDLSPGGTDGGHTEAVFAPGFPADPVLFARTVYRYYRSLDGGAFWQRVDPLPELEGASPLAWPHWVLSPSFGRDRMAWIDYGRLQTTNAGDTWRQISYAQPQALAAREWCEGERCGVLLLAGGLGADKHYGVFKSYDLGRTWHCPDDLTPARWPDAPPNVVWLPVVAE